ncbi:MAG: mechanosensitive ion channel domain-containing protein [Jannaschia sp.]
MEDALLETFAMREELILVWDRLLAFVVGLQRPRALWQVAIIVGLIAVSWLLRRWLAERMTTWMRGQTGRPKWQLRALVIFRNRLGLVIFSALSWIAYGVMLSALRFPSWSYYIELAATIATAWMLVSFMARLVKNPFLRKIVNWGLWIWVTLFYLGLLDEVETALDAAAFEVGDTRISILALLSAFVVLGVLFTGARFVAATTSSRISRNEDLSPSMRVLVVKVLQIVLYAGAFFIGLKSIGVDLTGLAVLSGAIGVGLGFGLQKVVSNLVSGVIILLDKSIKPGDVISLGETFGWVTTLTARYVSITTRDGKEYLIPNEDLITGQVVNWSHSNSFVRLDIYFGTAYANDPHLVRRVAIEAAGAVKRVLSNKAPVCHIVGFGDSSVDYILRFWISDPTGGLTNIRGNVYLALWDAFKEHDISIPFPQREVRLLSRDEDAEAFEEANGLAASRAAD